MDLANIGTKAKKWTFRIAVAIGVLGIGGTALYTYVTLHYVYSSGDRVGFVQKISKKGWVCKTNEGELSMVSMAGQQAQVFEFTVPSDQVKKQIEALSGRRLVLKYEEHVGIPSRCFGDTPYFVVGVEEAH